MLNSDSMSRLHVGPRPSAQPRLLCTKLNASQFSVVNGDGSPSCCNRGNNPGDGEDGEPVQGVESAKNVPWKKRQFQFLEPVGPATTALVQGEKRIEALGAKM
jgi:hypothetical protein